MKTGVLSVLAESVALYEAAGVTLPQVLVELVPAPAAELAHPEAA